MAYDTIITRVEDQVGIVQLNRPEVLNALNDQLLGELADVLKHFLQDDGVAADSVRSRFGLEIGVCGLCQTAVPCESGIPAKR